MRFTPSESRTTPRLRPVSKSSCSTISAPSRSRKCTAMNWTGKVAYGASHGAVRSDAQAVRAEGADHEDNPPLRLLRRAVCPRQEPKDMWKARMLHRASSGIRLQAPSQRTRATSSQAGSCCSDVLVIRGRFDSREGRARRFFNGHQKSVSGGTG